MPRRCVVCGATATEDVSYVQDKAPIILPGVAISSSMAVSWPYCSDHALEFKRRMRSLRIFQVGFVAPGFVLLMIGGVTMIPENHDIWQLLEFSPQFSESTTVGLIVAGFALMLVPAFTLFTKRWFYDAHLSVSRKQITISAKSESFINELREGGDEISNASTHPR